MKTITNEKLETISVIIAAVLLVGGFFFVRSALNDDEVKVLEKQKDERGFDEKPAVVYLIIENTSSGPTNIRKRMKNTNSALELVEASREEDGLMFEKIAYTYGTELDNINGIKSPEGYRWSVYKVVEGSETEEDITFEIGNEKLSDETTYIIRLTKIES
jgi:hypothetical protein